MKQLNKRGDTIIEVILAMSLLAFVLFSAWAITNRASQLNLTARQRVVMVNQLKEQAELLKALEQSNPAVIKDTAIISATQISSNPCDDVNLTQPDGSNQPSGVSPMIVEVDASGKPKITVSKTKSVESDDSQRVWVQKEAKAGYVDYYIRSCWRVTGNTQKIDNSQFIVRLNV